MNVYPIVNNLIKQCTGIALLMCCAIHASAESPAITALSSEEKGGLVIKKLAVIEVDTPFFISTVRMPMEKFMFTLSHPSDPKSLRDFATESEALVVANIGWLENYRPPILAGLQIFDNKLENGIKMEDPNLNSVVCLDGDSVHLLLNPYRWLYTGSDSKEANRIEEILTENHKNCIQTGPFLLAVEKGEVEIIDNEEHDDQVERYFGKYVGTASRNFNRSFIGLDKRNNVVIGITSQTDLRSLGKVLSISELRGGYGLASATILTGGKISGVLVKGEPIQGSAEPVSGHPTAIIVTAVEE